MGSNLYIETIDKCDVSKLRKEFEKQLKEQMEYSGHQEGYSGNWNTEDGLTITDEHFNNERDADDWISNNTSKWDDVKAVKVNEVKETKAYKITVESFDKRIFALRERIRDFNGIKLKKLKQGKSKRRTCKKCGSSIAIEYLHSFCSVCNDQSFILTPKDIEKKGELQYRHDELVKVKDAYINDYYSKALKSNWYWRVGSWCAC